MGVLSVFSGTGLFCGTLVFDFRGWRTRWIEAGDPDGHLRDSRRLGIDPPERVTNQRDHPAHRTHRITSQQDHRAAVDTPRQRT
jgi:hypothetical protein